MKINELFNVSGKVAIVTGGSRGIGEMIAAGFLANGAKVYITARKEAALIEKASELSETYQAECIPVPCDLSTMDGMEEFVKFMQSKEQHIDFLINNAGASWGEPYAEYSEKGWDKVMDLNVKSIFYLTQKLTPMLINQASADNPSRVINIGSIDGLNVPALESYAYGTSKAAVIALVRNLSSAIAPHVRINSVAPGLIETDMIQALDKKTRKNIVETTPLKRIGKPKDIANTVCYLLSEKSDFTTGQTLVTDGGRIPLP